MKELPKIMTIDAMNLFMFCKKNAKDGDKPFCFDETDSRINHLVIKQTAEFDECPLLHQIIKIDRARKKVKEEKKDVFKNKTWLLDKLIIVDFGYIFNSFDQDSEHDNTIMKNNAKDLMENGLDIIFSNNKVHMVPFDKSGNMSRNSRITFVNSDYYDELNERLNLGMDFTGINVVLSKYYAYRGLYLSSSKRVDDKELKITPETVVIIKDKRRNASGKGVLLGTSYERNIPVVTAKEVLDDKKDNNKSRWEFTKPEEQELEYVETPFDGVGMISPDYAKLINNSLKISGATSFQVRMPFVKGMLHQVNFQMFLSDFDKEGKNEDEYIYEDAFGIKRDLRKAQILLTETMFKCNKWLNEYCKNENVIDPMTIYCKAIEQYEHGLYISGTNLPYGNSKYTHLSYQMLNTLALTDEQFEKLIKEHNSFIENPIEYIRDWDSSEAFDYEKTELDKKTPSWKSALFFNDELKNDDYIASQLRGIQRGLVTKIANGKIVVTGQTRYLCRDLLPLLATLIKEQREVNKFYKRCLFMRFYMPLDDNHKHIFDNNPNYKYSGYGAFFRSPHLSRSEECLLQPFLMPDKGEEYIQTKGMISKDKYENYINMYDKYFGHLTGVVMVPRGSIVPLCLGGADFDGDLVNVVFDENVVEAVKKGCYKSWLFRKLPVVKIPNTLVIEETIPKYVPYDHIEKTFSNSIGLLSNTAISIAQTEYGKDNKDFVEEGLTCWKCTILTGLDIDAAKNGKHPDLSMLNDEYKENAYLKFRKGFERLRTNIKFRFDDLIVEENKEEKYIRISLEPENNKDIAVFIIPKIKGTKINELPHSFVEAYSKYIGLSKEKKKAINPFVMNKIYDLPEKLIEFENNCDAAINLYVFYKNDLLKALRAEKNREKKGKRNVEKIIYKKYDGKKASELIEKIVPDLIRKLNSIINEEDSKTDIQKRLNENDWLFQLQEDDRRNTLNKIIGKDKIDKDTFSEQDIILLCDFSQEGYKLLWQLIEAVYDSRIEPFDRIEKKFAEKKKKAYLPDNKPEELDKDLCEVVRAYYEKNLKNTTSILDNICISEIKYIMENSDISKQSQIYILYKLTKNSVIKRKLFWDIFSWEDIKNNIYTNNNEKGV